MIITPRAVKAIGLSVLISSAALTVDAESKPSRPDTLRWRQPELDNPIHLEATSFYFAPRLDGGRDYIIHCPSNVRTGDMALVGNPKSPPRNIVLVGCRSRGRLIVQYFSGVAHIEGTFWRPGPQKDGIDCGGELAPSGICRIQKSRVVGLDGSERTAHADCLQPWGRIAGFQVDSFTCDTNYQGIFLSPAAFVGFADLSRVNLRHNNIRNNDGNPGVLFWVGDLLGKGGKVAGSITFSCHECYANVKEGFDPESKGLFPNRYDVGTNERRWDRATPRERYCVMPFANNSAPYQKKGACSGVITGEPPNGDFAPLSVEMAYP